VSESVADQAIKLLAEQLGIDSSRISVARSVEVTWPDGSIGCPEPGFMYTQALVPGTLVELVADGTTYAFHQAGERPPFYCANPKEPFPS
jgi:hypothetical protein